jgi:hypothetical protein
MKKKQNVTKIHQMFKLDINASEYIPSNTLLDEIKQTKNQIIQDFEKNVMEINDWLIKYINEEYEKDIEKDQKNEDIKKDQKNEDIEKDQKNEDIKKDQKNEDIEKDQKNEDIEKDQKNEDIEKDQKNEDIEKKKTKVIRRRRSKRRQLKKVNKEKESNVKKDKMKTLRTYAEVLKG